MNHRKGADKSGDIRLGFDRRVRLEFHGSKISSDGGLVLFRELDEVPGLHDIAGGVLKDTRPGHNRLHSLVGLLRQSVFGRLAGYDDVNDADRPALDPVMRQVVGGRAVDATAASASRMGRFETEVLATTDNRTALTDVSGHWIDRVHERNPPPGSHWTWTVQSARPTAHRRAPPGTVTSAACAVTRSSSSTSSAILNAFQHDGVRDKTRGKAAPRFCPKEVSIRSNPGSTLPPGPEKGKNGATDAEATEQQTRRA